MSYFLNMDDDEKLRVSAELLKKADLDGIQCSRILGRGNLITIREFS